MSESGFIVSGYCYLLELSRGGRPEIRRYGTDSEQKIWIKTTQDTRPATRELIVDSIMGIPRSNTKYGREFEDVPGGIYGQHQVYDRTSHLKNHEQPAGGNIGFLHGHNEWRQFEPDIENGVALPRYGNSPGFFW